MLGPPVVPLAKPLEAGRGILGQGDRRRRRSARCGQAQPLFSRPRETDDEREDSSQDQPSGPNLKEAERFRPICRRWRPFPHEGIIQLARKR